MHTNPLLKRAPLKGKNLPCLTNEFPQHTFLWRNKKNYPRIIIISLRSPLTLVLLFRSWEIKQALRAWKAGSRISKGERENDLRVAVVHWSHSTLRSHFVAWRDELLNKRACRMSDRLIIK